MCVCTDGYFRSTALFVAQKDEGFVCWKAGDKAQTELNKK